MEKATTAVDPNANIIRLLSTGAVISSLTFGTLKANKQTEILAIAMATGKPPIFVDSFGTLSNTKKLADRLLAGEDVKMELEFNSIEISDDERKGLDLVRPLLERLKALKPAGYDWLPDEEIQKAGEATFNASYGCNTQIYHKGQGEYISRAPAKRIWEAYKKFVETGEKPKTRMSVRVHYTNRYITFNDDRSIKVGCTTISRAATEYAARHFKFETVGA